MDKKNYFCIILIFLGVLGISLLLIRYYRKDLNSNNMKVLDKSISDQILDDYSNVLNVVVIEQTEGGNIYYKTQDKDLIKKVINALEEIEIINTSNIAASDAGKIYIVELADNTKLRYYFQAGYYNKDGINYEIKNYNNLEKIKLPLQSEN